MDGPESSSFSSFTGEGFCALNAPAGPVAPEDGGLGVSLDKWTRLQYLDRQCQTCK